MTALRTRPPTGQVAWPLILLEGGEKAGKSFAAYSLSADPRVGRTFVLDLGEGTADEYSRLGPYEVIDHNGTYPDILDQLKAACAVPVGDGQPNVVVIDAATAVWELIKDWAESRARNSRAGRKKLSEDPDAEVDVPMNIWTDARERWYRIVNLLRRSGVIGVLICRAREVAMVKDGKPVSGQTDYKVEAEKGTPFAVKAQVRMTKPHTATLVAVHSLDIDVPAKGIRLPDENPLGHLVFDLMGAGTGPSMITHGVVGLTQLDAKNKLVEFLKSADDPDPKDSARRIWATHGTTADEMTPDQVDALMDEAMNHVARQATREAAMAQGATPSAGDQPTEQGQLVEAGQ